MPSSIDPAADPVESPTEPGRCQTEPVEPAPCPTDPVELPVIGSRPERADAARNRRRILAAAERLFTRDGVSCTSMDAIACEAGVGKGTLFRRFGDRGSLALALLDSSERAFQDGFIRGSPPLGPGAPADERLIAFGRSLLEHIAAHGDLLLAAQTAGAPSRWFDVGPYAAYRAHVTLLIREAAPELDAEYTAEAILAPLNAPAVLYQVHGREMPLDRLAAGWEALVRRLLPCPGHP
jgi:AcrR family transcriptional regulator